jgi:hypothetical protein
MFLEVIFALYIIFIVDLKYKIRTFVREREFCVVH